MFKVPLPRRQVQQPSSTFSTVVPPQSTALDLLSGGPLSFLALARSSNSLDISQSLDISETRIAFPHAEIVVKQIHMEVRYSVTFRSGVEGKK